MPKREWRPLEAIHGSPELISGRVSQHTLTSAELERSGQKCSTAWAPAMHSQDIDYLEYFHMGEQMPNRADYDVICRLCSWSGVQQDSERFSGTVTSSSSDEPEA